VVQRHTEPADDGRCRFEWDGAVHRHLHHEGGVSVPVPARGVRSDGGRRYRAFQGIAAAFSAYQDPHESAHAAP